MDRTEWELCGVPVVERCKAEILADIASGRVPAAVAFFAEMHNHVDANEYGGACEGEVDAADQAQADFWNRVHEAVDAWIKTGALQLHAAAQEWDSADPSDGEIERMDHAAYNLAKRLGISGVAARRLIGEARKCK